MQNLPIAKNTRLSNVRAICLVIGITSLAIFVWNILALALTADPRSVQWRVSFLEQIGSRSFALLFGFGLIMYYFLNHPILNKRISFVCLMAGILFQMSCILIIHDTLTLQEQALNNITRQSQQLRTEIQESANSAEQEAEQAIQQIISQEGELQQRAKSDITRAGIVSLGNLLIPGLGLLGLGRIGLKRK